MLQTEIRSAFVARTAELDYADAVGVVESLVGQEIAAGSGRLTIGARVADRPGVGAAFSGRLHTGAFLVPPVPVEIMVSPWSATRVEFGIGPLGRLGRPGSYRLNRFFGAAWPLVDTLIDHVGDRLSDAAQQADRSLSVAA
jgi:hypothetical protein